MPLGLHRRCQVQESHLTHVLPQQRARGSAVHPFWTMVLAVHVGAWLVAPSTAPGVLGEKLPYNPVPDGETSAIRRSPLEAGASLQEAIQTW